MLSLILLQVGLYNGEREMLSPQPTLGISLILERNSFYIHEDIFVKVRFNNRSPKNIFINTAFNLYMDETSLTFNIVLPDGKKSKETIPLFGKRPVLNKDDFRLIESGGYYESEIPINKWYEMNKLGNYKIRAKYHNSNDGKEFNLQAWTGDIFSDELVFKIVAEEYGS